MDLNIIVAQDKIRDGVGQIQQKIKRCLKLDFQAIALTTIIGSSMVTDIPPPPSIEPENLGLPNDIKMKIYSRLTVAVDDGLQLHKLSQSAVAKQYDLLALRPINDKVFNQILTGNMDCDIITFDFSEKSPLNFRKANFSVPLGRGIVMEINYVSALLSPSNRHNVIAYGQSLVRKTRGKNILLSSGARNSISLRGPHSVISLGLLFELKENQSRDSVYLNGIKALRRAKVRKNPATSAVSSDPLQPNEEWVRKELINCPNDILHEKDSTSSAKRVKKEIM